MEPVVRSATTRAALWMTLSAFLFGGTLLAIRYLADTIPAVEIVFFRVAVGVLVLMPWLLRRGVRALRTPRLGVYILCALFTYTGLLAWFHAVPRMPLGDATALNFTLPIFTILAAMVWLRESVGVRRWAATAIGFAGVLVILRPGFIEMNVAAFLVLACAAMLASAYICMKILVRSETPSVVTFSWHLLMLPLSLAPVLFVWVTPGWHDLPWVFAVGITGTGSYLALSRALAAVDASAAMPFDFMRLVFAAAAGFAFFGETLDIWTWAGAALIFASSYYLVRSEARTLTDHYARS